MRRRLPNGLAFTPIRNRNHKWESEMSMRRYWKSTVVFVPALLLAEAPARAQTPQPANPSAALTPVTDAMLRDPPASDWLMWRRTYNGWGYSPLDQINK